MTEQRRDRIAELEREVAHLRSELERTASPKVRRLTLGGIRRRARSVGAQIRGRLLGSAGPSGAVGHEGPVASAVPRFFDNRAATTPPARAARPDVSVVIPVFNSAPWLDDCLSSVLAQTGASLELICVNDGSTDASLEILQRYATSDPRVTILDQPNSGQSVARNRGQQAAAGRYLIFLDSDDFWPSDSLADLVADADSNELDVLLFDCFSFRDGAVPEAAWARYAGYYQRSREYGLTRSGVEMIADMREGKDYRPHVGMYLTRTRFLRDTGASFIPGIVHQDNPFTFSLLLDAQRVAHRQVDVYARRIRPGSTITALRDVDSVKGYLLSFLSMQDELRRAQLPPDQISTLAQVVYGTFDGALKKFGRLSSEAKDELRRIDESADSQVAFRILSGTEPKRGR
ncbi:glycosyltransferase [Microbacterium sp. MM2322]|uniref:glycosyltransferase n=1 Tax=Microbacterium sp. MM2322 TaxID=3157631 RepID=UPI0032D5ABDD